MSARGRRYALLRELSTPQRWPFGALIETDDGAMLCVFGKLPADVGLSAEFGDFDTALDTLGRSFLVTAVGVEGGAKPLLLVHVDEPYRDSAVSRPGYPRPNPSHALWMDEVWTACPNCDGTRWENIGTHFQNDWVCLDCGWRTGSTQGGPPERQS